MTIFKHIIIFFNNLKVRSFISSNNISELKKKQNNSSISNIYYTYYLIILKKCKLFNFIILINYLLKNITPKINFKDLVKYLMKMIIA